MSEAGSTAETAVDHYPRLFHRYVAGPSGSKYAFSNLQFLLLHSRIRVTRPFDFNDPFDCRALFSARGASIEDIDAFFRRKIFDRTPDFPLEILEELKSGANNDPTEYAERLLTLVHESVGQYLDRVRIVCFSEPDETGLPNDLLFWSHYADSHRGLCIVFDVNVLRSKAADCLKKVRYRTEYPNLKEYANDDRARLDELILFSKSIHWSREREWRLVVDARHAKDDGTIQLPPKAVAAIVLGNSMPDVDRESIFELCQQAPDPIVVIQASRDIQEYRLTFSDKLLKVHEGLVL